jgi:hypothetical protein
MTAQNTSSHVLAPNTAKSTVTWALAGLGVAAFIAVGANKATGGAIFAGRTAPASSAAAAPTSTAARAALVVESNVPDTTVALRGTNHPAPYNEEVTESEANETIEVTAPGHEGRRFWLKIDRPRTMRVELPLGSGLVDATFEETLVALGEQIATVEPGSQGTANDTRPATGGNGPSAWTGRRPGTAPREKEPAAAAAAVTQAPVVAAPPPVVTAVAPPPVVTQAPPVVVAPVAPAVAPGTVDPKGVARTVRSHAGEVQACYDRARIEKPDLGGRVSVGGTIDGTGHVLSAAISNSTANSARLEQCLIGAFRGWVFPPPAGGVNGAITYNFNFSE